MVRLADFDSRLSQAGAQWHLTVRPIGRAYRAPLNSGVRGQMLFRLLAFFNVALALATACFVYVMLPFAIGVQCEGVRQLNRACGPISNATLFLTALIPFALISAITYLAFRNRYRHPRLGLLLLLFCPVAIGARALVVWAS